MLFEWDPEKNCLNVKNHGIDFCNVGIIFNGPKIIFEDIRKNYGETRWILFGMLDDIIVNVVYTVRNDWIRIISARRANQRERNKYEQAIKKAYQEYQKN